MGENRNFIRFYSCTNATTLSWHNMNQTVQKSVLLFRHVTWAKFWVTKIQKITESDILPIHWDIPVERLFWVLSCGRSDTTKSACLRSIGWWLLKQCKHCCPTLWFCIEWNIKRQLKSVTVYMSDWHRSCPGSDYWHSQPLLWSWSSVVRLRVLLISRRRGECRPKSSATQHQPTRRRLQHSARD